MELAIALFIVAASVIFVVWSIARTWIGKSCHCSGCGVAATRTKTPAELGD